MNGYCNLSIVCCFSCCNAYCRFLISLGFLESSIIAEISHNNPEIQFILNSANSVVKNKMALANLGFFAIINTAISDKIVMIIPITSKELAMCSTPSLNPSQLLYNNK